MTFSLGTRLPGLGFAANEPRDPKLGAEGREFPGILSGIDLRETDLAEPGPGPGPLVAARVCGILKS